MQNSSLDSSKLYGAAYFIDKIAILAVGTLLMALAAKIQIPFWPVPMTLHTFAVMSFSLLFGPRMGLAILSAYLAAGAFGAPVFSGSPERGIGLAYMAGPTGGYLAGYWIAAWVAGALGYGRGLLMRFGASLVALAVVYALGLVWLAAFVPAKALLAAGFWPFLAGDLIKCLLAALVAGVWPLKAKARPEASL
ncbi:BioY family transporter [Allorhizobium taibaishanense]|uniref:Biotin transporter n=3 Tax=Allorhizobium taibaishanense TaxID=887144 RepID=A0A1Q9A404_9HYPH|nr:BioY family transporter [Allorhizobium taibaishanense]